MDTSKKLKGLVIIHVDGLSYEYLQKAMRLGHMPFLSSLIANEGYQALRYRCGVPSTTPYVQAGILYGDNDNIPSFRWWDKQSGVAVSFGSMSSFNHVAHKYFQKSDPLTAGGAAIATCYPDASKAKFHSNYRQRAWSTAGKEFSQSRLVQAWALNPIHLLDWVRRGLWEILKANLQYWGAILMGHAAAGEYVLADMLEEILLHHWTRFAVLETMKANYPVIYAPFYAYDETAHAFGPQASFSFRILDHVDRTIRRIASERWRDQPDRRDYELVILSDHGQVESIPFDRVNGQRFADHVNTWLPNFEIEESKGKSIARSGAIDGHIAITYSGGLAHFYFKDISWRLEHDEIEARFPGVIDKAARTPGVAFVLTRRGYCDIITTRDNVFTVERQAHLPPGACELLAQYDDPDIIARQLHKLNSFERSGDLILFAGSAENHRQINFENQVGGHGSLGGEQSSPFILAKREWNFDTSNIFDASGLYPLLKHLRDGLVN